MLPAPCLLEFSWFLPIPSLVSELLFHFRSSSIPQYTYPRDILPPNLLRLIKYVSISYNQNPIVVKLYVPRKANLGEPRLGRDSKRIKRVKVRGWCDWSRTQVEESHSLSQELCGDELIASHWSRYYDLIFSEGN